MLHFANPQYLYLLLLLPVVALLMLWARARRRAKLKKYGRIRELEHLMPDVSKYMPWVKLATSLLVMLVLIIIVARPRIIPSTPATADKQTTTSRGIEVMICLDVSRSMLASSTDDEGGVSRLERAKFILEKLVNKMRDDKVGLIVFAGDAYTQLPITSDYVSAKMFINSINTDMVPTQGTAIGSAIQMAVNSFPPDDKMPRAIVILTDGENFEDDAVTTAAQAAKANIQVDVIGLGGAKAVRIPIGSGQYLMDYDGQEVHTTLDNETAQQIATAGNGVYVNGAQSNAVETVDNKLTELGTAEFQRRAVSHEAEQFPVFAIIALILLIIDTIVVTRKISWLKRYKFFTK